LGWFLFDSLHFNHNYKAQFFDYWCRRSSSSLPEWVGITYAAYTYVCSSVLLLCQILFVSTFVKKTV
jgi:hypothetical protein